MNIPKQGKASSLKYKNSIRQQNLRKKNKIAVALGN
jgi:hypothetical protein